MYQVSLVETISILCTNVTTCFSDIKKLHHIDCCAIQKKSIVALKSSSGHILPHTQNLFLKFLKIGQTTDQPTYRQTQMQVIHIGITKNHYRGQNFRILLYRNQFNFICENVMDGGYVSSLCWSVCQKMSEIVNCKYLLLSNRGRGIQGAQGAMSPSFFHRSLYCF